MNVYAAWFTNTCHQAAHVRYFDNRSRMIGRTIDTTLSRLTLEERASTARLSEDRRITPCRLLFIDAKPTPLDQHTCSMSPSDCLKSFRSVSISSAVRNSKRRKPAAADTNLAKRAGRERPKAQSLAWALQFVASFSGGAEMNWFSFRLLAFLGVLTSIGGLADAQTPIGQARLRSRLPFSGNEQTF